MLISILKKLLIFTLLFHILSLAFFFMVDLPKDKVLQEPIRYAVDDGVYHMRLVENMLLGKHFPKRIYFDPYTYFPNGTYIHFPPLYDLAIAAPIWLLTLGNPTLESINKIAPYIPPIIGLLAIIVVFFIGKALLNKWAGLLSALLMATSSLFVYRSLFGATDHHQAEVLLSTLAILFLILTFKNKDKPKFWLYTILTGLSLGLYFLTWNGALLFLFIIFVSIILYYFVRFLQGESEDKILKAGSLIFFITLLMILPLLGHPNIYQAKMFNLQHYAALLLGMLGFLVIGLLGKLIKLKNLKTWLLPIFLLIALILSLLVLYILFKPVFLSLIQSFSAVKIGMVKHSLARNFVSEMRPLSLESLVQKVSYLFYFSVLAWIYFIYSFIKKRKAEDLLLIVWYFVILLMTGAIVSDIGQNRFTYYLAANLAVFCGVFAIKAFNFALDGIKRAENSPNEVYLKIGSMVLIFNIIFFIFYPFPFSLIHKFPDNLPIYINNTLQTSMYDPIQTEEDYYELVAWLKENTPEIDLDYYAYYQEPKVDPVTNKIEPYNYPDSAYGILTRWDLGHMITYYAHRIPVSNPFQEGLGRDIDGDIEPGETTFFIETNEEKAMEMLDQLKVKYIITDERSVGSNKGFYQLPLWAKNTPEDYYDEEDEPNENYYQSMIVRLHYFDAVGLDKLHLVYESETKVYSATLDEEVSNIKVFEYIE